MLLGLQEVNLDNKGRIIIPSKFRKYLPKFGGSDLYMNYYSKDFLNLYTEKAWSEVYEQLQSIASGDGSDKVALKDFILDHTEIVTPDASGRILLPPSFRKLAGFSEGCALVIVGQGDRMRIHSKAYMDKKEERILSKTTEELIEITQGLNL